ncbi:MAG TPA: Fic family protein [Gemmatimonadaceae bacterium]|nr:Fic family protein [Gemmatimonadaceae bacterium]
MPGRYVDLVWQHDPTAYAPAKHRRACRYRAFIPDRLGPMPLSLDADIMGVVSDAERSIRSLNADAQPALAPLARLLLRTESIASSKVEGMQLGARELARAEARVEGGEKASPTAMEILGNIDAMEVAVQDAARVDRFTVKEIVAIHRRLIAGSANSRIAGRIRTRQNWIGGNDYTPCGADFVPPPPEDVDALLTDLCDAVNDERLPPIVQAALVHAQFETIHPFDDGNGRTGRALIHVVLRRRDIAPAYVPPISVVLAGSRDRYIDGLVGFRAGHVAGWAEQFAGADARAAHLARGYLAAVAQLTERWRARLAKGADPRSDAAAWAVIDILPGHPMITAPVAAAVTGRAKAAIYQAFGELEAAGVLIPLSRSPRNRSWEAAGLLDLLGGLEAGRPPRGTRG